jgi:hypothetical protein
MLPILPQPMTAILFAALALTALFLTVVAEELMSFFLSILLLISCQKAKPAAWFRQRAFL